MKTTSVSIKSKEQEYIIFVGNDFISERITDYYKSGAYFIVDKKVANIYKNIIPADPERVYIFQAYEKYKNLFNAEKMLSFLQSKGMLRDGTLVVIGGGITGDIGAFAASTYMRGIKFIQIPTTLLAMVDSSVGGKTAVNLNGIKNSVGTFYQPSEVLIDSNFLNSLTDKEYLSGLAEVIKIACVYDKNLFEYIEENIKSILARKKHVMEHIIFSSLKLKADIVEQDEKEQGIRKLLNFGHTIAHGIESDSNNKIHHGIAVAIGMIYESQYALKHKHTDKETVTKINNLLKMLNYPVSYTPKDKNKMLEAISADKKAGKNGISLAISGKNMEGIIINNIKPKELIDLFP